MRDLRLTAQFRRDDRRVRRRGKDTDCLDRVIRKLLDGERLEPRHRAHRLSGDLSRYWECHILPWSRPYETRKPLKSQSSQMLNMSQPRVLVQRVASGDRGDRPGHRIKEVSVDGVVGDHALRGAARLPGIETTSPESRFASPARLTRNAMGSPLPDDPGRVGPLSSFGRNGL